MTRLAYEVRVQRFLAKIEFTSTCWIWCGARSVSGYGHFRDQMGRTKSAHRWMWELVNYAIPSGLTVDHLCRNRGCVNPDHLELVSTQENTLRGETPAATNARKTHCPLGHLLSGDNLYLKAGKRYCRACNRIRCRSYYHRRRERAA